MQCQTYGVLLLANLKKAVTISMTEQSRQQIINKRLQLSLQSQQKLLMASTQETQRVVQCQAAKLTQQDIHLRVSTLICLEVRIHIGIGNVLFQQEWNPVGCVPLPPPTPPKGGHGGLCPEVKGVSVQGAGVSVLGGLCQGDPPCRLL